MHLKFVRKSYTNETHDIITWMESFVCRYDIIVSELRSTTIIFIELVRDPVDHASAKILLTTHNRAHCTNMNKGHRHITENTNVHYCAYICITATFYIDGRKIIHCDKINVRPLWPGRLARSGPSGPIPALPNTLARFVASTWGGMDQRARYDFIDTEQNAC